MLNNSKHDIILQKNTTIGRTHQIAGITPLQVQEQHAVVSTATAPHQHIIGEWKYTSNNNVKYYRLTRRETSKCTMQSQP